MAPHFMRIIKNLAGLSQGKIYWLINITGGLVLLAVALLFQHAFDKPPCVLCIQVRLWIALFVLVCFAGMFLRYQRYIHSVAHLSVAAIALALLERAYQLLGTERGFLFSDCGFDLGMPSWFALDDWLPWLFRVETSCGYTPELFFGITMAEMLMVLSILLLISSFSMLLASLISIKAST